MFILLGAMCFHKIVKTANSRVIYSHNLFSFPDIPFILSRDRPQDKWMAHAESKLWDKRHFVPEGDLWRARHLILPRPRKMENPVL